jgi:hypothetical protein
MGADVVVKNMQRDQEIVRLRESRHTYRAIGDRFGLTAERVRQILHQQGRLDLLIDFAKREGINKVERVERQCVRCGKVEFFIPSVAKASRYCSVACAARHHSFSATEGHAVIKMRRAGMTWNQIAAHYRKSTPNIIQLLRKYMKANNLDETGVFGVWYGHRGVRKKKAAA